MSIPSNPAIFLLAQYSGSLLFRRPEGGKVKHRAGGIQVADHDLLVLLVVPARVVFIDEEVEGHCYLERVGSERLVNVGALENVALATGVVALASWHEVARLVVRKAAVALEALHSGRAAP